MKRIFVLAAFLVFFLFIASCTLFTQDISEIKSDEYVGEEVKIRGEVTNSVKLGSLSGFAIEDDTGSIPVASDEIPAEGETITITGVLRENMVIGYYIERN